MSAPEIPRRLGEFFTRRELRDRESGALPPEWDGRHVEFVRILDAARRELAKPMRINSWYRGADHPEEAHRAADRPGPHRTGLAVDIAVHGADAAALVGLLLTRARAAGHPEIGLGIAQKGGRGGRFVHFDLAGREDWRPRPWIWSY